MRVVAIAAVNLAGGIGYRGRLPWGRPPKADGRFFREKTSEPGASIVVGRKTWETLPHLPGRTIYVLSRRLEGAARSPEEVLALAASAGDRTLYVAGGREVYEAFAPYVEEIFLTLVLDESPADTYYPFEAFGEGWTRDAVVRLGPGVDILHFRKEKP